MSLIDIHFHGTSKIDIKDAESPEQILLIAQEYGLTGVEGFLITLYPSNINFMRKTLLNIKKAMLYQKEGAKILGAYLEGPFLNPEKAGALDSFYFLKPDVDTLQKLIEGFEDIVKVITVAPELKGALKIIEKCTETGIIISMGHSDATYKEAQEGFIAGAQLITHLFNAMRGIHHRELGIAGFGLINQEIYIELIGDGKHLNDNLLQWIFQVKNPERIILVSDMVKQRREKQILLGGSMSLKNIVDRLKYLNIDEQKIKLAAEKNPKRLLKINSL
ncbi:MAG: amidohydrolase family protein [Thermodesulfovibrio sp.]|uniref:amidohydrolase family protein n=1 Tax=unclassified Thermodesulfovibrio TaxID=2645936 RepID=UPI00083B407A|nr:MULTISPECIES: amidohydrolase family protein [unclassified Thermodesulfovibrio]MDI1472464.1 amidohydrolase family protein [Thermodesulfovibrio sp. 1176]MDI6714498.1 amidohydrolase family protein [Thermodesulfovibrio sp.]ODA43804.1 N-acetylglucosamine-6-phosphate deacetylase [Thermodesulfovibrio sp. N1]